MTKKNKTPLGILSEAIGLYFSNINKFLKYMTFPVLGQVLGLIIIVTCVHIYLKFAPVLIEKYSVFNNFQTLIFLSIAITLPGMIVLLKSFWEYLVSYGAVNSMLENMLKSGKVYDFDAHTELIKRRTVSFIFLWFLIGIFSALAIIPLFWVIAGIFAVYFVLIFQVFTFEPELSPIGCAKKSLTLIKGHFASTFMLMAIIGAITYLFVPNIVVYLFDTLKIINLLGTIITPIVNDFPIAEINSTLAQFSIPEILVSDVSASVVQMTVSGIIIGYTLPLRSILWGMWYKELNNGIPTPEEKIKEKKSPKRKSKRPSEKLMEESHKKFTSKRLDKNILKRAMEKDD